MLKDGIYIPSNIGNADLSIDANHTVSMLLNFIDNKISGFRNYYLTGKKSDKENFITNQLVNYFNSWLNADTSGFIPYKFSFQKNPAQDGTTKETDIGIFILNTSKPTDTIFEFEAKRLSESSNNHEYVYGDRGGIERFKRNFHGAHLKKCGMFGYVQSQNNLHWIQKINDWISKCPLNQGDQSDWSKPEEKLIVDLNNNDKFHSVNSRITNSAIELSHYFINLS